MASDFLSRSFHTAYGYLLIFWFCRPFVQSGMQFAFLPDDNVLNPRGEHRLVGSVRNSRERGHCEPV